MPDGPTYFRSRFQLVYCGGSRAGSLGKFGCGVSGARTKAREETFARQKNLGPRGIQKALSTFYIQYELIINLDHPEGRALIPPSCTHMSWMPLMRTACRSWFPNSSLNQMRKSLFHGRNGFHNLPRRQPCRTAERKLRTATGLVVSFTSSDPAGV